MLALALALALLIGISLGLLGSGGSIITLPVLVYVARIPPHEAVGMSLVIVGGTSIAGSLLNARRGAVDWKAGGFFAASGIAGAKLTHLLSAPALLLLFGLLMVAVGLRLLLIPQTNAQPDVCRPWRCLGIGLVVGVLTGFLGVGGGFLILPALVLFAGLEMKRAIGTSLAVIAVNCLGGIAGQLRYTRLNWLLTLVFLAAAVTGMLAGTAIMGRFSADALRRGFAWCVIALGAALVGRNGMLLAATH